ncbi:hypothetical protein Srot_0523 [Segniliparus rotundus DSM 44985]|uniref:Uncharacterized protein n=1 Tax=Segniliparus rotundus (strain ATCC BAA-972 / CDC 1076 / CIP 108378 / DSM 44985 / JCM 13578) TaxID=640132 RepID=D6ZCG5_SEGRD|nr:hypothetical protein Srot_0523 [Segniliparus rotundus DSM 44985]
MCSHAFEHAEESSGPPKHRIMRDTHHAFTVRRAAAPRPDIMEDLRFQHAATESWGFVKIS